MASPQRRSLLGTALAAAGRVWAWRSHQRFSAHQLCRHAPDDKPGLKWQRDGLRGRLKPGAEGAAKGDWGE